MGEPRPETISSQKLTRLLVAIVAGFLVPMVVLALLIEYVQTFNRTGAGSDALTSAAIARRIKPVAHVEVRAVQAEASSRTANVAPQAAPVAQGEAQARAALASIAKEVSTRPAAPSANTEQAGKLLYEQICQACHASGLMGAPKRGDRVAWAPRLKEPMETIYRYALKGKGNMPPKGGSNASDADVKAAVDYMLERMK